MKKTLLVVLLATLSWCSQAKDITFGMETAYAPFEYYDSNNKLTGFDVEIATKICEKLEYNCKFVSQSFDSIIPSLKTRRIDAAISGIDITEERSQQVDFSVPYYENSAKFIVMGNDIKSIAELKGKRVGIQNGTTHQKYLIEQHPDIDVVNYDSYQYAVLDLKANRIDAIFSDSAVADEWLEKETTLTQLGDNVIDPNYFGKGLGIATRKNNTELLNQINQALTEMKKDGSYQAIYDKWFGK